MLLSCKNNFLAALSAFFLTSSAQAKEAELCVFGTAFKVPLIPQLHGYRGFLKNHETNQRQMKDTGLLVFSAYRRTPDAKPILDSILGRKSNYTLDQLRIGKKPDGIRREWQNLKPKFRIQVNGTIRFIPKQLAFFGNPVEFTCFQGLPVYSDDAETHSCSASGLGPGASSVFFSFSTGHDGSVPRRGVTCSPAGS